MVKTPNDDKQEPEIVSEIEKLKKLGIMFDSLEKQALKLKKKEIEAEKDNFIDKANKQKDKENILELKETTQNLEGITSELIGVLHIPIELFINEGLSDKGITPISIAELEKILNLIVKLLPTDILQKITEISKKTSKIPSLKNLDKLLSLSKHLIMMFYPRYIQFKTWKKLQEKNKGVLD